MFTNGLDNVLMHKWLARTPATYCAQASHVRPGKYRWQKTFTASQLRAMARERHPEIGRLQKLEVTERGRGGTVIALRLTGDRGEATLVQELNIRQFLQNLNSGSFVIRTATDASGSLESATFFGGGWGHGVGMCQMGAIGRAEHGHTHEQILRHYYNGATLGRIYESPFPSSELEGLPIASDVSPR